MILLLAISVTGTIAGLLLLRRVPMLDSATPASAIPLSVIVPARNEERNLPRLLASLQEHPPDEVLIIDDHSTDATRSVALAAAATVITSEPLPAGWTGKNFACFQGASAARNGQLLFLDADTWMEIGGLGKIASEFARLGPESCALSVLPFHVTIRPYEELSLFFNLLMVFGAGGFGAFGRARLFGQSMVLSRDLYQRSGTHGAVRGEVLENFMLAERILAAGGKCACFGGKNVLHMRMFPEGFPQLCEGWTKAFASGAASSDTIVLCAAVYWLTALCTAFLWLVLGPSRGTAAALYAAAALQVAWMGKQLGSFRWYTYMLFPIPLLFFFTLFARSLIQRRLRRPIAWRGRQL